MNAKEQFKEQRENLYQELKDILEATKAEDFKYYDTITEFQDIIDKFEALRNDELHLISCEIK